jgi:hypothetical protein
MIDLADRSDITAQPHITSIKSGTDFASHEIVTRRRL